MKLLLNVHYIVYLHAPTLIISSVFIFTSKLFVLLTLILDLFIKFRWTTVLKSQISVNLRSETRKLQRLARDNVHRIFEEQEKLNYELETKKRRLDSWSKELNKRETLTELERQKLDEEKKKVIYVKVKFSSIKYFHS